MFNFIKRLRPPKEDSVDFRRAMAARVNNKLIRYVSERDEHDEDIVVGRNGSLNVNRNGELLVSSEGKVIFRVDVDTMTAGELMSLDGVILEGFDKESGRNRKIIAYYVYYRK